MGVAATVHVGTPEAIGALAVCLYRKEKLILGRGLGVGLPPCFQFEVAHNTVRPVCFAGTVAMRCGAVPKHKGKCTST